MTTDPREVRDWRNERFESAASFYREVYDHAITSQHSIGRVGAALLETEQTRGDWSDAATPDLVVATLAKRSVSMSVDFGAGRFSGLMKPNEFVVVAPDTATDVIVDEHHSLRVLAIPYASLMKLAGADSGLREDGDFGRLHIGPQAGAEVQRVIARLCLDAQDNGPHARLAADARLLELAAALLAMRDGKPARAVGGLAPVALRRCLDAIRNDVEGPSLSQLAEIAGLSGSHFSRAFKASTGLSPAAWSMRHRISEAEAALASSSATIAEIAVSCGFASQQHFTTAFKRYTGATPAAWRRERWR